jgi:hypothetical protein
VKITGLCRGGHHAQCTGTLHRLSGGGPCGCPCHANQRLAEQLDRMETHLRQLSAQGQDVSLALARIAGTRRTLGIS